MARPKKQATTTASTGYSYLEYEPTRKTFIRGMAQEIVLRLTTHNGKVNPDYAEIAVSQATKLADLLFITDGKKNPLKSVEAVDPLDTTN